MTHARTRTQQHVAVFAPAASPQAVLDKREQGHHLVTVRVDMPHLRKYGRSSVVTLAYGATFDVKAGDAVMCPPTRLNKQWTKGTVIAVDDLVVSDWSGRLKYVAKPRRR